MAFIGTSIHHHHQLTQPDRHHILTYLIQLQLTLRIPSARLLLQFRDHDTTGLTGTSIVRTTDSSAISDRRDNRQVENTQTGPPLNHPEPVIDDHVDDAVLQILGAGHWFLEGWIGDHSVEFLVDSASSVTAMSDSLYQILVYAGAPVGTLGCISRTLCGANGTGIRVSGCSNCVVSFMGLLTEFPILVCDLASGTDAIIGTDVLGSVLPHTLDIRNGLLFTEGGASLHRRDAVLSGHVFTVGQCSFPPYSEALLHCTVRTAGGRLMPSSGLLESLTVFSENTGLVIGRTLVEPSRCRVPVLMSNFSQETVMVEPFSEVGIVTQVSAIQVVTETTDRPPCGIESLPMHLRDLLDQPSRDLDDV